MNGLREFLEALPDPAFMIDRSAVIRAANGPAHHLFGYPPGHLASQNLQLILPDLAGQHVDQPSQLQSARDKSGRKFQVEVHARPLELAGNCLTLCMIRNGITSGSGNRNGGASGSMERHRRTLDQMMEGCQIIATDWGYLYVNDAVCRQGRMRRVVCPCSGWDDEAATMSVIAAARARQGLRMENTLPAATVARESPEADRGYAGRNSPLPHATYPVIQAISSGGIGRHGPISTFSRTAQRAQGRGFSDPAGSVQPVSRESVMLREVRPVAPARAPPAGSTGTSRVAQTSRPP